MKPISQAWCMQIDITNFCGHDCLYCSRYNKHLRADQRKHMSLEFFETALQSLKNWQGMIGIIGGEPILHPQFREMCTIIRNYFPKSKMGLWTSGGKRYPEYLDEINKTFGFLAYNEHNPEQKKVCKHQPLTIAIKDVVKDEAVRNKLIDGCWVQRTWCPTINHFGGYFCEVAAGQDVLFNDGANAYPIEPDWWNKTPEMFKGQVDLFCNNCGMAIPMERDTLISNKEKVSQTVLEMLQKNNSRKITEEDLQLFTEDFSKETLQQNIKRWYPGNYRVDLHPDETCAEGLGYRGEDLC